MVDGFINFPKSQVMNAKFLAVIPTLANRIDVRYVHVGLLFGDLVNELIAVE